MDLVDGDGALVPDGLLALLDPLVIGPVIAIEIEDHGGGLAAMLAVEGVRVALDEQPAVGGLDLEFVVGALGYVGEEDFPDAGAEELAHGMVAAVPAIEIADDADALGIRRPDGEAATAHALELD